VDWQAAFNIVFAVAMVLGGWVMRVVWDAIQRLATDMKTLENKLPETYARRDDMVASFADLKQHLVRIEAKLDGKQDK
jgi:Tfp pilus assembly protein PilO